MINIIRERISTIIEEKYPEVGDIDFTVEIADEKFGDYSSNVALILAKVVGESPEKIAVNIIDNIKNDKLFESVEFAKPGFINFKIALPYLQNKISEIVEAGENYGNCDLGKDLKINVEFISANPTGPLTIGNARGGVIGDTLSNVFVAADWKVTREYYFNDAGGQIDVLGHSVLKDDKAEYKGDYIDELGKQIKTSDYKEAGKEAAQIIIGWIKATTKKMGIKFDVWTAEGKDLREKGKLEETFAWMKEKKLTYEKDGALWFRSTEFSDDKDRVLIKSTGEPTYFGVDAAYHRNKLLERKFDKAIDVWGADHHGDVSRIKGFVKALGFESKFEIIMNQFVRIVVDGKEVRMSKRTGNFIAVDDVIKEVGVDAYRFFMLAYDLNSHLNFDLNLAKEQSQKNPVYYVQYAYARIHSILAKCQISNNKLQTNFNNQNIKLIKEPAEIELVKELIKLPDLIIETAENYQVQKLTYFAVELANKFHNFYEHCRVISEDDNLTAARIELVRATKVVLKKTLDLMGISAPEKM